MSLNKAYSLNSIYNTIITDQSNYGNKEILDLYWLVRVSVLPTWIYHWFSLASSLFSNFKSSNQVVSLTNHLIQPSNQNECIIHIDISQIFWFCSFKTCALYVNFFFLVFLATKIQKAGKMTIFCNRKYNNLIWFSCIKACYWNSSHIQISFLIIAVVSDSWFLHTKQQMRYYSYIHSCPSSFLP